MKKEKVFGIGANKTGTTSLKTAMEELGYSIGNQRVAELLVYDYAVRDFSKVVDYCRSADFFQDTPFSKPYTYIILDHEFPGSKFILTVRDSAEQWYKSVIKFQTKLWGKNGNLPTEEDLKNATYIYKGRPWHTKRLISKAPKENPYDKESLVKGYLDHIESVKFYFRHRPDDLLVLNVAKDGAYQKLCSFLGVESDRQSFPWKNKTSEKTAR